MVVNTPAVPLYIVGDKANVCTASKSNLLCFLSTSNTTPGTTSLKVGQYWIGLTWTNPDSLATVKYDGLMLMIDINAVGTLATQNTCGPSAATYTACTESFTFKTGFLAPTT